MTRHRAVESAHTPEAVRKRLEAENQPAYLRDFIYGAVDGCVTTFAIVAGVVGAERPASLVVILGFANLFADGLSMAIGNYLGTRAEAQLVDRARRIEEHHVDVVPDGERQEIREIFRQKGFEGELLERVVEVITSDQRQWVETMLRDEWGLSLTKVSPVRAAVTTFLAFVLVGFVPLVPYTVLRPLVPDGGTLFAISVIATGVVFFIIGAMKAVVTETRWWRGGIETLLMGGTAAGVAYLIGMWLRDFG